MSNTSEFTPEEHYKRGRFLLERGHGSTAFEHLSRAYLTAPQKPEYRSAYALALALVRGQFLGAVDLARGAVREEFYNPELYLNLAQIYATFGFKAEAIRYLKRGLMVDPEHSSLQKTLAAFGVRRKPPIRFLPREHLMNRLLGKLHARVLSALDRSAGPLTQIA